MRFAEKIAIVTGAAQGIGAAAAKRFASEGAHVVVVDRQADKGAAFVADLVRAGHSATFAQADVSSRDQVNAVIDATFGKHSRIDILVNSAGIQNYTHFLDVTEEEFDHVLAVNLKSTFYFSQGVARRMVEAGTRGAIVNMVSIAARLATPGQTAYGASKGAIDSMTRVAAVALSEHGIRVNAVAPGTIMTEMAASLVDDKEASRMILSRIPLRRFGEADEIAGAICYLASEDASYITGQTIFLDGGRTALNFTVPVDA